MTLGLLLILLTPAPPADLPQASPVEQQAQVQVQVQDPFAPSAARERRSAPGPAPTRNCLTDPFASNNRVRAPSARPLPPRGVRPMGVAPRVRPAPAQVWGQGLQDPFTSQHRERRERAAPMDPAAPLRNPWDRG